MSLWIVNCESSSIFFLCFHCFYVCIFHMSKVPSTNTKQHETFVSLPINWEMWVWWMKINQTISKRLTRKVKMNSIFIEWKELKKIFSSTLNIFDIDVDEKSFSKSELWTRINRIECYMIHKQRTIQLEGFTSQWNSNEKLNFVKKKKKKKEELHSKRSFIHHHLKESHERRRWWRCAVIKIEWSFVFCSIVIFILLRNVSPFHFNMTMCDKIEMQNFFMEHIKNAIIAKAAAHSSQNEWSFSYF